MPRAKSNGIDIEYDTFGDRSADPMLLVMGLGAQMILWDEEFCEQLADRGHWVVRFDNRDVGLSSKLDSAGTPDMMAIMQAMASGGQVDAPYLLWDMADDAAGLLDELEVPKAHIVGASMGGMIVQALAIRHAGRVQSMTSIMSSTGNPELPPAKPEAMAALMRPRAQDRETAIEQGVETGRLLYGGGFEFDEDEARERGARIFDRCNYPEGVARQMTAIVASGSRTDDLAKVSAPTLVIHGDEDPLVPIEGGHDTVRCVPGSELLVVKGMGHAMPRGAWPQIVDAIAGHTQKAGPAR